MNNFENVLGKYFCYCKLHVCGVLVLLRPTDAFSILIRKCTLDGSQLIVQNRFGNGNEGNSDTELTGVGMNVMWIRMVTRRCLLHSVSICDAVMFSGQENVNMYV